MSAVKTGQESLVLVLDVGKTDTRLAISDAEGRVLETARRASHVVVGQPYPHLDVDSSFEWMLDAIRSFANRARIECIVPVAHGATAALLAGDELVLPVLDYEWEGVEDVGSIYERPSFDETRSPNLAAGLNLGRQLCYQSRAHSEKWARITDILLYPQYWAWRFTGRKAAEFTSLGCHTDLWNPELCCPSTLWGSARWPLRESLLPPVASAWSVLGPPTAAVRARTGLSDDCRVLCGVHDSNAAYFSHRSLREEPFAVISSGTWVIVMAHGTDLSRLDPDRDMLANVDVFGDPVATARFMGGREFEAIVGQKRRDEAATLEEVRRVIASTAIALPAFADQGGQFQGRRGELRNANGLFGPEREALASLYLALRSDVALDLLDARDVLIVEGPLARNDVYLDALAGLRPGQAIFRSRDETGSLRGAVNLASWPRVPSSADLDPIQASPIDGLGSYRKAWRDALGLRSLSE